VSLLSLTANACLQERAQWSLHFPSNALIMITNVLSSVQLVFSEICKEVTNDLITMVAASASEILDAFTTINFHNGNVVGIPCIKVPQVK
jgi:hypothetical protein